MAFAQLEFHESLRDIELTLTAKASKLFAGDFRHRVHESSWLMPKDRGARSSGP